MAEHLPREEILRDGAFAAWRRDCFQPSHAYKALSITMEPLSSQQTYVETRGIQKLFLCKDIQAVIQVCPEKLCSLRPRRFSRPQ